MVPNASCSVKYLRVDEEWVPPGKAHEDAVFNRVSVARKAYDCPPSDLSQKYNWEKEESNSNASYL